MTTPNENDINSGSGNVFSFLLGFGAAGWERLTSIGGALVTVGPPPSAPVTYALPNGGVLPVVGGTATDPQTTAIAIPPWATDCTVFATYTAGVASTTPGYTLAFFLGYGTSTTLMSADRADGNGPIGASAGPNSAPLFSRAVVLRDMIGGAARLGISAIDQDGTHPGTLTISVVFHRS